MTHIHWHGEHIELARLIKHYRWCAREWKSSAGFWRTLTRTAIAQAREQRAAEAERLAA